MNRRTFLFAGGSVLAVQAAPSDQINLGVIGSGGRGTFVMTVFQKDPALRVTAICDVYEPNLENAVSTASKTPGTHPKIYRNYKELLADKDIQAVLIATPEHWHAQMVLDALAAGKDVYVEKPCSHDMFEARQISTVMEKYNRIVQHGTNSRSGIAREAIQKIHEGLIGDVYMARGLCFKWRDTIGRAPVSPVPPGVHYDLWLGGAPQHEFTKNRFHYNWHWFWDYGNGDLGNQGIHQMDVARWALGVKYPAKISAIGGHMMFDDDQETPNLLTATYEFDEGGRKRILVFEVRHWMTNHEAGMGENGKSPNTVGTIVYGPKGYVAIWDEDNGRYSSFLGKEQQPGPSGSDKGNNWANFIAAVRSREPSDLNAPITEGAISTMLVHLANISYRVGRTLEFDPETYTCKGDAEANALFRRKYRAPFEVPQLVG